MESDNYKIDISTMNTVTASNLRIGDITIDTMDNYVKAYNGTTWNIINPCSEISINAEFTAFKDYMPPIEELERMCEEYPGLEKAYENFKTFYKLVEQDWQGKQKNKKS